MKRVVITGMGIVCSLGKNKAEVLDSLKKAKSGIKYSEVYAEMGLRSHVQGEIPEVDPKEVIDRKMLRFMGDASIYNALALDEAIKQSGLSDEQVSNERTGLITGSGGASNQDIVEAADILREKGIKRVGPYRVPPTMGSTTSACLSTLFKIKGINYSITSACSTSAHCIGNAMEQIQLENKMWFLPAAVKSWTGHLQCYLMLWVPYHLSTMTHLIRPHAPTMPIVTALLFLVVVVHWF